MESKLPTPDSSFEPNINHEREVLGSLQSDKLDNNAGSREEVKMSHNISSGESVSNAIELPKVSSIVRQGKFGKDSRDDNSKASKASVKSDKDDGLIEKEWVDRIKKVISSTKEDPYLQEREISRLQADYLKKRYGKDVKMDD